MKLECKVAVDEHVLDACRAFDFAFEGISTTEILDIEVPPAPWNFGLVTGSSGSGKSTFVRKHFGESQDFEWDPRKAIVSQMPDDPKGRLMGVGLNSIPSWCRPYHVLSTGEKFRADMARRLCDGAIFDEFTSTVDRQVAKSCCAAVSRYIKVRGFKGVVFATCHRDIVEWLCPDWVVDMEAGERYSLECLRRPSIKLNIHQANAEMWRVFRKHHYLDHGINKSSRCFAAFWGDQLVGFASALAFPNKNFKNAWREHRTVVLPDFQGLGIGVRLSDFVAKYFLEKSCRYFSKTSHPRMGEYRQHSPLWKPTSKNLKSRPDYDAKHITKEDGHKMKHTNRVCYSHEFVGNTLIPTP
jgi:GNAT superfamily N-acetyltransferase